MKEAIYAASLDPITHGHVNVVERALKVFDRILVGIGINETKKSLFSLEERESMARTELARFGNRVRVKSFQGMLSDFAYENNISTVIRGARSTPDFDYEKLLSDINRYCGLDTIIYTTTPELAHVSSSAAKAITLNAGRNILDFVSMNVKRRLEEELLYQYRIGITGMIGAGKSFISDRFQERLKYGNTPYTPDPHIIDMDSIGHYILEKGTEPVYKKTRDDVREFFSIKKTGDFINMKILREKLFKEPLVTREFNKLMLEPMMYELRKTMLKLKGAQHKKSLIIVTGALLCEMGGLSEFNNNLILVNASETNIVERLKGRGYSDEVITQRIRAQSPYSVKSLIAAGAIRKSHYGHVWNMLNNSKDVRKREATFDEVLKALGVIRE
jgi:pantetheine-phosphate adenylyltransferase